jgi:hypothetical protein
MQLFTRKVCSCQSTVKEQAGTLLQKIERKGGALKRRPTLMAYCTLK